jgi:aminoglycoside phosphotransferase (APT) family kinase protein
VWPEVAAQLRRGVARTLDALPGSGRSGTAAGWPLAPVLAHGDFTPGQVLLGASGRAGIVDLDTLCFAEPALDVGRFLAYLQVTGIRRSRGAWPLLADLTAVFLEAYLDAYPASGGPTPPAADARRLFRERTAAYRALALARLGASACWKLKDDRLAAVVDVLDADDEWTRSVAG